MSKKGIPHRKWTKEQKLEIIRKHLDEHIAVTRLAKQYNVGDGLICTWVKTYLEEGEEALVPHHGNRYAALYRSKNLSETERLRLIVARQEIEIARLKKGYWTEGDGAKKEFVTGCGRNMKLSKNLK